MKTPSGEVRFSKHAERRIGERLTPVCKIDRQALVRLVESGIPRAVSVAPGGRYRRIIAVPVDVSNRQLTVYLVVTFRGGGTFVITCLTPEMVAEHIDNMHQQIHSKHGQSKKQPTGRAKKRRGGRQNRIQDSGFGIQ